MEDASLDDIPDEPKKKGAETKSEGIGKGKLELVKPKEKKWVEDEYEDDAEVIKMQVGESIEGLLVDKYPSRKYDAQIYKIKVKGDDLPKIIVGTTILDRMMKSKEVSALVKIERLPDGESTKGKPLQNWKTYHLE